MSDTTERMQECARAIQVILPPGTGFVVLAFDFNLKPNAGRLDYVSNANREDIVKMTKEFIQKTEAGWGKHLP